jgi:hypothetical protein
MVLLSESHCPTDCPGDGHTLTHGQPISNMIERVLGFLSWDITLFGQFDCHWSRRKMTVFFKNLAKPFHEFIHETAPF